MLLDVEVKYPQITLAQCYALHKSEHYQQAVAAAADTQRQLVGRPRKLVGGGMERVAQFSYRRNVDGWLQRILQEVTPTAGHTEYSTYVGPQGGFWSIRGGVRLFPQAVTGNGVLQFVQRPDGVVRRVRGDIFCELPLALRWAKYFIEPVIVGKVAESLRKAAAYTPHYIAQYGVSHSGLGPRLVMASRAGAALGDFTAPNAAEPPVPEGSAADCGPHLPNAPACVDEAGLAAVQLGAAAAQLGAHAA